MSSRDDALAAIGAQLDSYAAGQVGPLAGQVATLQQQLAQAQADDAADDATIAQLQAQVAALQAGQRPTSPSAAFTKLAFFDDFTGPKLDPAKWNINAYSLPYEMSENTPGNVQTGNGLSMLVKRETSPHGRPWTSSYIDTRGKFEQRYGYFEVCFWAQGQTETTAAGLWDAPLWLRSTDGTPGELDVVELWGRSSLRSSSQVYPSGGGCTSLLADTNHKDNRKNSIWMTPKSGRFSDGYHRVGLEWTTNGFAVYLDGAVVRSIPNAQLGLENGNKTPFSPTVYGPMHLRIQRQVGQLAHSFPDLTPGYWGIPDANTAAVTSMQVKYAAVWTS